MVTIEAMLPFGVAAMIECLTESKARTLQDVRYTVNRNGGIVTPTAFLFERKGKIWFQKQEQITVDDALEEAIDAGALDIIDEEGALVIETPPAEVTAIAQHLQEKLRIQVERSEVVYAPKEDSMITLTEAQGLELQKILDFIEEESSLQNLYINAVPQ